MTDPAIIEAAARALSEDDGLDDWEDNPSIQEHYRNLACLVLAAVTPLIEAVALERAAKVAEDPRAGYDFDIAATIRALQSAP